jgi:hypothetical protein
VLPALQPTDPSDVDDGCVRVDVPAGVSGEIDVVVVTAAGVESTAYRLSLVPDRPVVTGVDGVPLVAGHPLTITGRLFRRPDGSGSASVRFGDVPVLAASTTATQVTVPVPATVAAGGTCVVTVVGADGGLADPLALPVAT